MGRVKVEIGPVATPSADAWFEYATEALLDLRSLDDSGIDPAALAAFESLLEEWSETDRSGGTFHWIGEESPEQVEFLMRSLFRAGLAIEHAANLGQATLRPPEADEFHMVLVGEVLALLQVEGDAHQQFVASLREEWGIAARQQ
jgi:hypothetical protein